MAEREIRVWFQVRWVIIAAAAIAAACWSFFFTLSRSLDQNLGASYKQTISTLRHLQGILAPVIGLSVLVYLIVGGAILVTATIFVTHRIAGPLSRMEKIAEDLRNGRAHHPIELRAGDEIVLLAGAVRELQESLAGRLHPLGRALERVDEIFEEFHTVDPGGNPARARELLARIDQELLAADAALASPATDAPGR